MRFTLITQLALIAISLIIMFVFVKPMFSDIGITQDQLRQYSDTIAKASEFNGLLQQLVAKRDSISSSEMEALDTFIPSHIDQLKTMNEIQTIFDSGKVTITSLTAQDEVIPNSNVSSQGGSEVVSPDNSINYQDFSITFTGSYQQMKDILAMIESDATLLEVEQLSFGAAIDTSTPSSNNAAALDALQSKREFKMVLRAYGLAVATK